MLVVISDLHFEEEKSHHIPSDGTHPGIIFTRNLPAKPYRMFINHLAHEARHNKAQRLDFVLAGDIFDMHRTSLWFTDNPEKVRPYLGTTHVDDVLEEMLLKILRGIATEPATASVLSVFQLLGNGRYLNDDGMEQPFPVPVTIHYIPGNHDRLINSTPAIRRAARQYLGMPVTPQPFPYTLSFENEQAFIRHGHEYDQFNFGHSFRESESVPGNIPARFYQSSPLGDLITVDVATRLGYEFRKYHGDNLILRNKSLRTLYLRLLEFDDLRPMSAMFNYFIYRPESHIDADVAWEAVQPVVYTLLEVLHDHPFLQQWLDIFDQKWHFDVVDAVQAILTLKPWRWAGIPLSMAESVSEKALNRRSSDHGPERFAAWEESILNQQHRYIIAGHTHRPKAALIAHDRGGERYYLDTGTWRNRVPATPDFQSFGRLKALSYTIVYGAEEDLGAIAPDAKVNSFDFWAGFTQRWEKRN